MATPGSIVVGTDGSPRAERAVHRAGELASALGAKVHVVSGYRPGPVGVWTTAASGALAPTEIHDDGETRALAQRCVDRAQERLRELGVASEAHVFSGEPAEALIHVADAEAAQMIIVGNRGMTGARRVLGSVPNHVSHHARCDVLIVPTDEPATA
ncbi:MAG TPA: universal stress protein [Solirubrobacteraceae bacterium]|nr:universal stress protein [Solirubrobacteraceae bacterium]